MKLLRKSFNPWVLVFVGTAIFHIWRGSLEDILIFGGAAALILSQVLGLTGIGLSRQPKVSSWLIGAFILASALILYFSPRHSLLNLVTLLIFIPIGIFLLMYRDPVSQMPPRPQVLTARLVWGVWAVCFALIELVAYVGSKLTGDLGSFPTISVLLDPVLDESFGRAIFVVLWLMAGVYLFGVRRR